MLCWGSPNSKHAFALACTSMVSTTSAAVAGLTLYMATKSPLCLVYGLENVVDLISDMVVVWRFYSASGLTAVVEERLNQRELRAGVAISTILGLLGVEIMVTAIQNLTRGHQEQKHEKMIIITSSISLGVFGILTFIKLRYSFLLDSPSLRKDGICSLIGTILSLCLLIDVFLVRNFPASWWFDPTVSLICGVVAFAVGLHAIIDAWIYQKLPILRLSWWLMSQTTENPPDDEEKGSFVESDDATNSGIDLTSTPKVSPPPSSG